MTRQQIVAPDLRPELHEMALVCPWAHPTGNGGSSTEWPLTAGELADTMDAQTPRYGGAQ